MAGVNKQLSLMSCNSKSPLMMMTVAILLMAILMNNMQPTNAQRRRSRPSTQAGPSNFLFYTHNRVYSNTVDNPTFNSVYSVGPVNFTRPNPYSFGVRSTFEDRITSGSSPSSRQIGIAQGLWVLNSQSEFTLFHIFTATITDGPYQGAIHIMGQMRENDPERLLSVVGGTGDFLGARGLALNRLVFLNSTIPAFWTLSFNLTLFY